MSEKAPEGYAAAVEAIETSYEFMLAYAAQGRQSDQGGGAPPIRARLESLRTGLLAVVGEARAAASAPELLAFLEVMERDVAAARAKVDLVLAAPAIGSQLVDNLNASIHLRAVLTDLFLLDEYLKTARRAG
jgi:hypothetical protein